jgi:hypothetical protein
MDVGCVDLAAFIDQRCITSEDILVVKVKHIGAEVTSHGGAMIYDITNA